MTKLLTSGDGLEVLAASLDGSKLKRLVQASRLSAAAGRWARLVGVSPAGRAGRLVAVRAPAAGIGGRVDAESPPMVAVLGMFSPDGGDGRYGLKPESAVF